MEVNCHSVFQLVGSGCGIGHDSGSSFLPTLVSVLELGSPTGVGPFARVQSAAVATNNHGRAITKTLEETALQVPGHNHLHDLLTAALTNPASTSPAPPAATMAISSALAALAALAFLALPHTSRATVGVDVSQRTSTSAFQCLKRAGFEFAVVRCYQSVGRPGECPGGWRGRASHADTWRCPRAPVPTCPGAPVPPCVLP